MQSPNRASARRTAITIAALVFEMAHLGWEHLHGGVAAHHLLNRADLPAISNWWGLLLIPALAWILVGRVQWRLARQSARSFRRPRLPGAVLAGFAGALGYGVTLALAFTTSYHGLEYVFLGAFAVALLVPVYRAEFVLGFIVGMTFTFGAVLPTILAVVIACFARLAHAILGLASRLVRRNHAPRPL